MSDLPHACCPEELGIPSGAVKAMTEAWEKTGGPHSFMLLRHGKIAAEGWWKPYAPEKPHMLFSLSKSFTAAAAAFAETEGLLDPDAPVLDFFPEYRDVLRCTDDNIKKLRVRHLLSMCTGHVPSADFIFEYEDCAAAFLASKPETEPGSRFSYNTGATYMVSAVLTKITGMKLADYLGPRLFGPLGIRDAYWDECARGISYGGFGLNLKTEDIAKFGLFLLNRGVYDGARLLPAQAVDALTEKHIANSGSTKFPFLDRFEAEDLPDTDQKSDWAQGYGRQFWRCVPPGVYRGDGAFGQLCVVMPEYDAVLAVTAGTGDMQAELNAVWDNLLPAFSRFPLPPDEAAYGSLREKLRSLAVPLPEGTCRAQPYFGRTYQLTRNSFGFGTVRFEECAEGGVMHIRDVEGRRRAYTIRSGEWTDYRIPAERGEKQEPLSSKLSPPAENDGHTLYFSLAGASGPDSFRLSAAQDRTPFVADLTFGFTGDRLEVRGRYNVGFSDCGIRFDGCAAADDR